MLKVIHLYPDLMNLYGDQGNLSVLERRSAWYGEKLQVVRVNLGERIPFEDADMIFMGGGSDREQGLITKDFVRHADSLLRVIEDGMPVLAICGAYQMLGKEYITVEGERYAGLQLFSFHTEGGKDRLIGNIALETTLNGKTETVVGFENHGGRTWLDDAALQPWGKILTGYGNNGQDGWEGMQYRNLIATYLHGPLLPKNPKLADFFLKTMFERQGLPMSATLDDTLENFAHEQILQRLRHP